MWKDNNELYRDLLNYLGYGSLTGKYWFIGMEENWGSLDCVDDISSIFTKKDYEYYTYNKGVVPFNYPILKCEYEYRIKKSGNFEYGINLILDRLTPYNLEKDIFVTNLRFIPISDEKVGEYFKIDHYETDKQNRRKILLEHWSKNAKVTFCLGTGYRDQFKKVLLGNENNKYNSIGERIEYIQTHKKLIVFMDHPSSIGWFNKSLKDFDKLIEEVKLK